MHVFIVHEVVCTANARDHHPMAVAGLWGILNFFSSSRVLGETSGDKEWGSKNRRNFFLARQKDFANLLPSVPEPQNKNLLNPADSCGWNLTQSYRQKLQQVVSDPNQHAGTTQWSSVLLPLNCIPHRTGGREPHWSSARTCKDFSLYISNEHQENVKETDLLRKRWRE